MRRIGIIGGMGPEATTLLMLRVIGATEARDGADHVPMLVDMNPQVPSRIDALIHGTGRNPGPVIGEMAKRLETGGAEALAMPCNTAHFYADDIRSASPLPFLSMLDLSADAVARIVEPGGKIGILASPATQKVGLFDGVFLSRGLDVLFPDDSYSILSAIRRIKVSGPDAHSRAIFAAAAEELRDRGADVLLVGCSEFSLIADAAGSAVPVIDTLDILTRVIVEFSGARLKQQKPADRKTETSP